MVVQGKPFTTVCYFCFAEHPIEAEHIDDVPNIAVNAYDDGWRDIYINDYLNGWACPDCFERHVGEIETVVPILDEIELLEEFVEENREEWMRGK